MMEPWFSLSEIQVNSQSKQAGIGKRATKAVGCPSHWVYFPARAVPRIRPMLRALEFEQ